MLTRDGTSPSPPLHFVISNRHVPNKLVLNFATQVEKPEFYEVRPIIKSAGKIITFTLVALSSLVGQSINNEDYLTIG